MSPVFSWIKRRGGDIYGNSRHPPYMPRFVARLVGSARVFTCGMADCVRFQLFSHFNSIIYMGLHLMSCARRSAQRPAARHCGILKYLSGLSLPYRGASCAPHQLPSLQVTHRRIFWHCCKDFYWFQEKIKCCTAFTKLLATFDYVEWSSYDEAHEEVSFTFTYALHPS